jgi:hypothetical protein
MDTQELETTVSQLGPIVAQVVTEHTEYEGALATQQEAEAALLGRIIDMIKPALRALASGIVKTYGDTAGQNGCNPVSEREYFEERGVCLVNAYTSAKDSTGNCGRWEGERLYLLSDGRLAETSRTGTWSRWQGDWDRYEATIKIVDAAYAVKDYELADIVEALTEKLNEQIKGQKTTRTKAARSRAEKLAALATLVGGQAHAA